MRKDEAHIAEQALAAFVPLNALAPEHRRRLGDRAVTIALEAGESLSEDYDGSAVTYYLLEGELGLYAEGRLINTLHAHSDEARFALNQLRAHKVAGRAHSPVVLLELDVSLVSTLLIWVQTSEGGIAGGASDADAAWMPRVLESQIFARIPPPNILQIFKHLKSRKVKSGEVVVRQGDPGDYYYIVRSGHCAVSRTTADGSLVELAQLGPGDSFGEEALITGAKRNATVSMTSDGVLMYLTKDDFRQLIIEPALDVVRGPRAKRLVADGAIWLDVRVAEEHENLGIEASANLPLHQVRERASELDPGAHYIVYSNSGRRSMAAAFLLTELGFRVSVLRGGLLSDMDAEEEEEEEPGAEPAFDAQYWSDELARANEDVEEALREKLEATSARRLWEEQAPADVDRQLKTKRQRLELESNTAGRALAQALRRKLEIEAKLRAVEADATRRRAQAEAMCERLRGQAEARLREEEEQLVEHYAAATAKLDALKRIKEETEERLRNERERIDAELADSRRTLQDQAEQIKGELERLQGDAERKAAEIRSDREREEQRVRRETEAQLREERSRLEGEFARSVDELAKAQKRLERAEAAMAKVDQEAARIVAAIQAAQAKRRRDGEAARRAESDKLSAEAERAKARLEDTQRVRREAEEKRLAASQKLERLRAAKARSAARDDDAARTLEVQIREMDESVSQVVTQVDAAQRAVEETGAAALAAEEKAARQRATEEEIRLKLHEEAEQWLSGERDRSQADLDRAKAELAARWAEKEEADRKRRERDERSQGLLADVTAQLEESLGEQAFAERRASLTESAQKEIAAHKEKAQEALQLATEHLKRLKRQGLID